MKIKNLIIGIGMFILLSSLLYAYITPQDSFDLREVYNITGATYVNATLFYGNGSQLTGIVSDTASTANSSEYWDNLDSYNSSELERQSDGNLGIFDLFITNLIESYNYITANYFNQDLNTTDNVTFNKVTTNFTKISEYIDFEEHDSEPNPPIDELRMYGFDQSGKSRLRIVNSDGIQITLGRDSISVIRNGEDDQISAGEAVYLNTSTGNVDNVYRAIANNSDKGANGIMIEDCASGDFCYISDKYKLEGIDLSAYSEGDRLFLSPTVPGGITNVAPDHPYVKQQLGVVSKNTPSGILNIELETANHLSEGTLANEFEIGDNSGVDKSLCFYDGTDHCFTWDGDKFILDGNLTADWFKGSIDWSNLTNIVYSDFNNQITLHADNITNNPWIEDSQESDLNVNSSNFWDNYDTASDLNNKILLKEDNITDLNHFTNNDIVWSNGNYEILLSEDNITDLQNYILSSEEGNLNVNYSDDSDKLDGQEGSYYLDNENNYVNSVSFSGTDTVTLTLGRLGLSDLSDSFTDRYEADTNETIRVDTMVGTDCGAGNYSYGFDNSGNIQCREDTDTTYSSSGTLLDLSGTTFSVNEGTLTSGKLCTYVSGTGIVCNSDDSDTTYTAGSGLDLTGTEFSHNDSSSQASSDNSGRTYIQDIILDTYGHIIGITTATETVTDTNTNIIDDNLYNTSELENQSDGKLGIIDSFINGLIDIRVTSSFVNALFPDNDLTTDENTITDYLNNLTDVNHASTTDGQILVWDNTNSYFTEGNVNNIDGTLGVSGGGTGQAGGFTSGELLIGNGYSPVSTTTDIVQIDTTPQLGGNLDTNQQNITNTSHQTFCNGATCWKQYVNASGYMIIEEV